ncbi:MAG: NACHT domain-containing protein [Chloroflexi bacterium]|nr:NACHT domain-containing protein [Chloroflexota bacterium]
MPTRRKSTASTENKNISINGDVRDSSVFIGDNNTVNQTFIQKIINIFKSDAETLEQRNRRILLGHVENAWIKGVLDASLHGAALLDLGIKPDPEAVTKYPWAIKKESTDETLPAGLSMLEIFDSIGMGRSLLILGAPGSGKTTMLLELARGLIARAREDVTQPIPMVFNLASWTEKLTLADWLAQELNNLYSVPRKTAPDWVKGDKLLLLLDGLDEVRQDSRAKCVEAINEFRKEHGLTSLAVCSRSQDYADLNTKLSFEGAIEVQPLTQGQITEFFNRFGDEMAGIKQALEKDSALREMAETPLFLSIMLMAYQDKRDVDILMSGDEKARRKHLFDTYVERMFERYKKAPPFEEQKVLAWLNWLSQNSILHNQSLLFIERFQPLWMTKNLDIEYRIILGAFSGLVGSLPMYLILRQIFGNFPGLAVFSLGFSLYAGLGTAWLAKTINTVEILRWNWKTSRADLFGALAIGSMAGIGFGLLFWLIGWWSGEVIDGFRIGLFILCWMVLSDFLMKGLTVQPIDQTFLPGQRLIFSIRNSFFAFALFELIWGMTVGLIFGIQLGITGAWAGGLLFGLYYGGYFVLQHYSLRLILARNNLLPWKLVPFLDHCVDLIFLRRVGGGYIFVHRLLMEHFAEMYVETPTSKGN